MHGRKKSNVPKSESELAGIAKKIKTYNTMVQVLFIRRSADDSTEETLQLTGTMLTSCPDFYSLWNYRREILIKMHRGIGLSTTQPQSLSKISSENGAFISKQELDLSSDCIRKNPKSYNAWQHRKWIIQRFIVNYEIELELCKEFLRADQRNFHCWSYRRFLVQAMEADGLEVISSEMQYSQEKIDENFSNYSAFHHRSVYFIRYTPETLSTTNSMSSSSVATLLEPELSTVENAIFTEPDDQSAWWYHQFLLKWAVLHTQYQVAGGRDWLRDLLKHQCEVIKSLLDVEVNCKWAMNALICTIELLLGESSTDEQAALKTERALLLGRLCELDKLHINRYLYKLNN